METLILVVQYILHVNVHLRELFLEHGAWWVYVILFLVVFAETGLVVTPFLPGDSLLFAAGALAASTEGALRMDLLFAVLMVAPLLGDQTNYWTGRLLGAKIPFTDDARFLKKKHLDSTQAFYAKFGGATVILARFAPIVRTFAPFVAGLGRMDWFRYTLFSALGAFLWVGICLGAGYLFGNIPVVQKNFSLVILGIVAVSLIPMAWAALRSRTSAS
ncbi:MAG: DedA family protein [Fibrobacteria bacterium]|nr:DedA family protein [Fibrobacteria bacterium]